MAASGTVARAMLRDLSPNGSEDTMQQTAHWPRLLRASLAAALLLPPVVLGGCSDDSTDTASTVDTPDTADTADVPDTSGTCTAGASGCACKEDQSCDGALTCVAGTCAEVTCSAGTVGCACNAGGGCEGALVCTDGVCGAAPGGALGDPCGDAAPCGKHTDGSPLTCTEGICRITVVCTPGTQGCPCNAGSCGAGLACKEDVCDPDGNAGGFTVSNPAVRACGLVIEVPGAAVAFGDGVIGRTRREGARLAVTFVAASDAPLGVIGAITDGQGGALDLSGVTPVGLECFDRLGAPVTAPGLSLQAEVTP